MTSPSLYLYSINQTNVQIGLYINNNILAFVIKEVIHVSDDVPTYVYMYCKFLSAIINSNMLISPNGFLAMTIHNLG